jgi:alpha-galactosidase
MPSRTPKIAMIGAGSAVFSRRLIADVCTWPALAESELALVDVNPDRLALMERLARRIVRESGAGVTISATTQRERALEGAAHVVTTIAVGSEGGRQRPEVAIPERYGVHQSVADTIGVGGVFRYLRTMPSMLAIGQDIQHLAPDALWLNYVNPMNMIMWTIARALPKQRTVGLCHSVQGTAEKLARFVGVPHTEVAYCVAGINHQAWFLEFKRTTCRGEDLYPRLFQAMEDPAIYDEDRVRFEVMRHFGYFVTESSYHMSEYVPWFRRTQEDRQRYAPVRGQSEVTSRRDQTEQLLLNQAEGTAPVDLKRSREYCSSIIHAIETNTPFRFNGNVPNTGLIPNLPPHCSVEVPIFADNAGLHPCYVGELPSQLAAINRTNVNVQELAVNGFLNRDKDAVFQACAVDPLCSASINLEDTRKMVDELFEAQQHWLEGYTARLN